MTTKKQEVRKVPNLRFPEFGGEWEEKRLSEIAERVIRKNKENNQNILTISAQFGLISQLEFFNKSVSAKDVTGYYLLHKNDFAYNKSYSNGYPMGAIKRLNRYEKGVVSTLYICFKLNDCIDNAFVEQSFETGNQNSGIEKVAQEGARNHGLLNIGVSDFFNIKLNIPSLPEQIQIASFLTLIDERIQCQIKIIDRLETSMRFFRERIFKQLIRFKNEIENVHPDWKVKKLGEIVSIQGGYAFKSEKFNNGEIKVFRIGDIVPYITIKSFTGVYSSESPNEKYIVRKNDFLMALSGATFGKVGKIHDNSIGYINQRVATFRTTQCLDFFYHLVQTDSFKSYINSIPTASAQPNISNDDIGNYITMIPSVEEQIQIASFLSSIDEKIEIEKQMLDQYKNQKGYLLQNMFI